MGITSVKSRRHTNYENPVSKSTRKFDSDEDSEPADPELSDDETKPSKRVENQKNQTVLN